MRVLANFKNLALIEKITELALELWLAKSKAMAVEEKRNTMRSIEIKREFCFLPSVNIKCNDVERKTGNNFFLPSFIDFRNK